MGHGQVRLGFVALIDAAPLLVTADLGYFIDEGLDVALHRELGWANIRDKLAFDALDAAHALIGMPIRAAMEGGDRAQTRMVMALGTGGDAITLSRRLIAAGVTNGPLLQRYIRESGASHRLTLAHVSDASVHHYVLRDWLARSGIDPDRHVTLKVFPPPQLGTLLAAGHIDGFCSGEPWNLLAQENGRGRIVALTGDHFPSHPDKVLAVNQRWLERQRPTLVALIRAITRGAAFCADPANAPQLASMLCRPEYLDAPAETILRSLRLDRGFGLPPGFDNARPGDWSMRTFDATPPDPEHVRWFIEQMKRWKHASSSLDSEEIVARAIDGTAYAEASNDPRPQAHSKDGKSPHPESSPKAQPC